MYSVISNDSSLLVSFYVLLLAWNSILCPISFPHPSLISSPIFRLFPPQPLQSKLFTQTAFTEYLLGSSLPPCLFIDASTIMFGGLCVLFLLFTFLFLDQVLSTEHISFTYKTKAPEVMNNYNSNESINEKNSQFNLLIHWNFRLGH